MCALRTRGTDYFAQGQPPSPVQQFWSLSVEEQFYFVWPALLAVTLFGLALGRRSAARRREGSGSTAALPTRRILIVIVVLAGASLAWSIHQTGLHPSAAYFSTRGRAWELALGAMLAVGASTVMRIPRSMRAVLGWLGLIAIAVAGVSYSASTAFPGVAALLPTVGAALVIAAGMGARQPRGGVGSVLSTAPLCYVGDRSYTFYLWHWPVLIIAVQYAGHDLSVGMNLLLLVGAFLLSVVSYRLFENPIRRARWRAPVSAGLVPVSIGAVAAVAVLTLVAINSGLGLQETATAAGSTQVFAVQGASATVESKPLPAVVAAVKAARQGAKLPSGLVPPVGELLDSKNVYFFPDGCVPIADSDTTSKEICRLGDAASPKTIVVVGDSHAQMWMPAILAMAERDGWAVVPLVKSRCVPSSWLGKGYPGTPAATLRQCHAWYKWAVLKAKALHPDVTLLTGCCGSAPDETGEATKRGFVSLAKSMKPVSKSVVAIADNEGVNREPTDCLLARKATMRTCTSVWPEFRFALNDSLPAAAKAGGFGFLKTRGWFCFQRECPMVVGGTIVYRDKDHITMAYALKLAAVFRDSFRRCVLDTCPQ